MIGSIDQSCLLGTNIWHVALFLDGFSRLYLYDFFAFLYKILVTIILLLLLYIVVNVIDVPVHILNMI